MEDETGTTPSADEQPDLKDEPVSALTEQPAETPATPARADTASQTSTEDSDPQLHQHHAMGSVDHGGSFLKSKVFKVIIVVLVLLGLAGGGAYWLLNNSDDEPNPEITFESFQGADELTVDEPEPTLDYTKLPLGDGLYSDTPRRGYVFSCSTTFNGGGADEQGPWIDTENSTWDLTEKLSVQGSVSWPNAVWKVDVSEGTRTLTSSGTPHSHNTGTFPIATADPAYAYDRNPNTISEHDLSLVLPLVPVAASAPECVGGEVGIATSGALIFSAFDAGGRDAVATEVQDGCQGHPQSDGHYHYHGYSSCFDDDAENDGHSDLLGYAFDGFGIFGIQGEDGVELSTADLDECHGHTHTIDWNGAQREMYHYHFTQDFPYTVSCFMGEPIVKGLTIKQTDTQQTQTPQEGGAGQGPIENLPPPPGSGPSN